ncbi:MAG: hypothetical protein ACO1OF_05020 [Adhaeribacter sp.]
MNPWEYITKKDKSTLIGQIIGIILIGTLFFVALHYEKRHPDGRLLAFSIILAGIALGWAAGILLSPQSEFNDEATKFTKVQGLIATFITGALAVKLLPLLTEDNLRDLFKDFPLLSRILYFIGAFIISAIIVYYDRVYLGDQDIAKLSFRRRDMLPNSKIFIPIGGINDNLKLTFHNQGPGELKISRSAEPDVHPAPTLVVAGQCLNIPLIDLGPHGDTLTINNADLSNRGKFKLRIS